MLLKKVIIIPSFSYIILFIFVERTETITPVQITQDFYESETLDDKLRILSELKELGQKKTATAKMMFEKAHPPSNIDANRNVSQVKSAETDINIIVSQLKGSKINISFKYVFITIS